MRRKPWPDKLEGETEDGEEITVPVAGEGSKRFADATAAIRDCTKIKALDSKGQLLRVLPLDPDEDPELAAADELEQQRKEARTGRAEIISIDVPKLVDSIASNMERVAAAAATQQATAFRDGFAAMTSIVNLCLELLVRTEQRLAAVQDATEAAAEEKTPGREQLAMLALQQAMSGAPNGATNGAATMDPAKLAELARLFQHLQGGQANGDAGQ